MHYGRPGCLPLLYGCSKWCGGRGIGWADVGRRKIGWVIVGRTYSEMRGQIRKPRKSLWMRGFRSYPAWIRTRTKRTKIYRAQFAHCAWFAANNAQRPEILAFQFSRRFGIRGHRSARFG